MNHYKTHMPLERARFVSDGITPWVGVIVRTYSSSAVSGHPRASQMAPQPVVFHVGR